jgi:hypothetical protein
MRSSRTARVVYHTSGTIYLAVGAAVAIVAAFLRVNPASWDQRWPFLAQVTRVIQNYGPLILLVGTATAGLGKLVRGATGSPKSWALVHEVLDQMRRLAFRDLAGDDPLHYHRITLFKAVGLRWWPTLPWPKRRWLVPYERSGYMTREHATSFSIPDSGEGQGIAGRTWVRGGGLVVANLPEIQQSSGKRCIKDYAERTFVSVEFVQMQIDQGRPLARSFCGIPVEVRGNLWGVLVFDSRQERPIEALELYRSFARVLGRLLERGA